MPSVETRESVENLTFAGLNKNENRKKEQAFTLKNVYVRNGSLYPRKGSAKFTTAAAFANPVKSAGYYRKADGTTRYIASHNTVTANILTANQSDVETDTAGFTGKDCTLSRVTAEHWHGAAALKALCSAAAVFGPYLRTAAASVAPDDPVSAFAYVKKGLGSYNVTIKIVWLDSGNAAVGTAVESSSVALSTSWQRVAVSGTAPANTDKVEIRVYTTANGTADDYFFIDGLQVEKKSSPFGWILGGTSGYPILKANAALDGWDMLELACSSATIDMVTHINNLIIVSGTHKLKYDGSTLADLGGSPPDFKYLCAWKFRLFGWGVAANPNYLYFCGYDSNGDISSEVWPADFVINAGDDNQTLVACIDFLGHLALFKERGIFLLYGNDENDFDASLKPSEVGTKSRRSVAKVGNTVFFLDSNTNVRQYAGGGTQIISEPVRPLLETINTGKLSEACGIGYNDMYLLAVNTDGGSGNNKVLVCDILQNHQWYLFEFPFRIHQFVLFGDDLYAAGDTPHHVFKINTGTNDYGTAISCEYGFRVPWMRHMRPDKFYMDVTPVTSGGTVDIFPRVDDRPEDAARTAGLSSGQTEGINFVETKLPPTRGRTLSLRIVGEPFPVIHRASIIWIPESSK